MAIGLKLWETRDWPTRFRGLVAIHAAKGFPLWAREFAEEQHLIDPRIPLPKDMPLGCLVAVGEITDCKKTTSVVGQLSETEQSWGDYGPDRFAFGFTLLHKLTPIQARGALGFWEIPELLLDSIRGQVAGMDELLRSIQSRSSQGVLCQ